MSSPANEVAEGTRSLPRRFLPPLWLLAGVLVLLVTAGFYFIFWRPFQLRAKVASDMERYYGADVEYREFGPAWLRQLTGHHYGGVAALPKVGGILDQVVSVRAGRPKTVPHQIPEDLIRQLQHFPALQRLDLTYTNVTDDWLPGIAELKSLRRLELGHARVGGRGFHHLRRLPHLEELDLFYCPVRDQFLDDLAALPLLKHVNLSRCSHLTPQAISRLRTARPDVKVQLDVRMYRAVARQSTEQ